MFLMQIRLYCGSVGMSEYGKFSENLDGDGISTKPLVKLEILPEIIYSLKKNVIYCAYGWS
jgi:hypothetical protein